MFEDALVESGGKLKTKSKYYTFVGILLNGSIIAALILIPLIYPEALPKAAMSTLLVAPPPPPRDLRIPGSVECRPEPWRDRQRSLRVSASVEIFLTWHATSL